MTCAIIDYQVYTLHLIGAALLFRSIFITVLLILSFFLKKIMFQSPKTAILNKKLLAK